MDALEAVKRQQREMTVNRDLALATLRRELELIVPGEVKFIAYALLVPTTALKREVTEHDSWNHAYVYVYDAAKKTTEKRKVKTGHVQGDKTELTDGIESGMSLYKKYDDGEKVAPKG